MIDTGAFAVRVRSARVLEGGSQRVLEVSASGETILAFPDDLAEIAIWVQRLEAAAKSMWPERAAASAAATASKKNCLVSGWMTKRATSGKDSWKRRFFKLDSTGFFGYYDNETDIKAKGGVQLCATSKFVRTLVDGRRVLEVGRSARTRALARTHVDPAHARGAGHGRSWRRCVCVRVPRGHEFNLRVD